MLLSQDLVFHLLNNDLEQSPDDEDVVCALAGFVVVVGALGRIRTDFHHMLRPSLPPSSHSSWKYVREYTENDMPWLEMLGFTRAGFRMLLACFAPAMTGFWVKGPQAVAGRGARARKAAFGRPRSTTPADALALALHYVHSTTNASARCQLFSMTPSVQNRTLNDALQVLYLTLRGMHVARVKWPSANEMATSAARVHRSQPLLNGVFGFVDGLNLSCQEPSDPIEQNSLYNQWLCGCFASSLFVYDSFGTIIYALLNAPGSQHDSTLAAGLYDLLRSKTSKGFALAADAAFCSKGELKDKVWKPLTTTQLRRASDDDSISVRKLVAMLKKHRAAVSVRQGAEWGMGSIQNVFRRVNLPLSSCHPKRLLLLQLVAHLFNLRVRTTGISQIGTVYDQDYMGCLRDTNPNTYFMQQRLLATV